MERLLALMKRYEEKEEEKDEEMVDEGEITEECEQSLAKINSSPEKIPAVMAELADKYAKHLRHFYEIMKGLLLGSADHKQALTQLSKLNIPSTICGKAVGSDEFLWACDTCTMKKVESCIPCYCNECFIKEKHVGHSYYYQLGSENATCDCGDDEWLVAESFCPIHKKKETTTVLENLLPPYNKNVTPLVINSLQKIAHSFIDSTESHKLNVVLQIYKLLHELVKSSEAFVRMVTKSFLLNFADHQTTHVCEAHTCEESQQKVEPHPCVCNVMESLAKKLIKLGRNKDFSDFIAELIRYSPEFGDSLFEAFWKNYCYIFDEKGVEETRSQVLYKILWQCSIEGKALKKYLPLYSKNYIACLKYTIDRIKFLELDSIPRLTYFLMYDFHTFMNADYYMGSYFIEDLEFFKGYLLSLIDLEFTNSLTERTTHVEVYTAGLIREIPFALEYFMRIFMFILRSYDMKNVALNRTVFKFFTSGIQKIISKTADVSQLNSFNIPFIRCFSYFLNKFIYLTMDLSSHPTSESYFAALKQSLVILFEMPLEEFDKFVYELLRRVIRTQNFAAEGDANLWVYYGRPVRFTLDFMHGMYKVAFVSPDIALIQNLLSLLPEGSANVEELLELVEDEKLFNKAQKDTQKIKQLRDRKWHELCCILFNTDCRLQCYIACIKEDYVKIDQTRSAQLIKKEAIRTLLQTEDKNLRHEHIDTNDLVKAFPPFMRHKDVHNILEMFFVKKRNFECTLGPDSLKYYDYASFLSQKDATNSEFNMREIVKRQKLPNFTLLQTPPRLQEDLYVLQSILKAIDKGNLFSVFERYQSTFKETPKDIEIVNILFLKIASEAITNPAIDLATRSHFLEAIKPLPIENPLVVETKKVLLEKSYYVEESKAKVPAIAAAKMKEQQEKIKQAFMGKMHNFAEKHAEELQTVTSVPTLTTEGQFDEICSICKESLNAKEPFGRVCMTLNNKHYAKILTSACQKCGLTDSDTKDFFSEINLPKKEPVIKSCGHYMHLSCFQNYSDDLCPACKTPMTNVLPYFITGEGVEKDAMFEIISYLAELEEVDYLELTEYLEPMFDYIWKSIAVGACASLAHTMSKRFEDLKYMYEFLVRWRPDGRDAFLTPLSFSKAHLANTLNYYISARPKEEDLESFILGQVQSAVEWVLFRQAFSEAKTVPDIIEKLKGLATIINDSVHEDVFSIMTEMAVLKALIMNWDKEKIGNFLTITTSEDIQGKLSGFQKILFPSFTSNVISASTERLLKEAGLPLNGVIVPLKNITDSLLSPLKNNKNQIWSSMVGTTKGKLSLVQNLPETFSEFQLTYFTKNCSKCNTHIRDKYLCLFCGSIVCGDCSFCKGELAKHSSKCNGGVGFYVHTFYGNFCIVLEAVGNKLKESLYKSISQRDITAYTINARSMISKDLEEYKLSKESYRKWNNVFVTDRLHIEFRKGQFMLQMINSCDWLCINVII
eukprot:TRINITY_DN3237_c7_g1_i1.p1 TRINITY_DN3237_c7_g1~~TRINITY_DN3237_c7_g1_i1.p1  ORF type:complete len:1460 (-),score=166.32 TRINITY_DN3237_c7_g1_i1:5386-9765(-)